MTVGRTVATACRSTIEHWIAEARRATDGDGLVVRLGGDTLADLVLAWMMEAIDELCPVQLTGAWRADVHLG